MRHPCVPPSPHHIAASAMHASMAKALFGSRRSSRHNVQSSRYGSFPSTDARFGFWWCTMCNHPQKHIYRSQRWPLRHHALIATKPVCRSLMHYLLDGFMPILACKLVKACQQQGKSCSAIRLCWRYGTCTSNNCSLLMPAAAVGARACDNEVHPTNRLPGGLEYIRHM